MADTIIVLDGGDEEASPQPSCSASPPQPGAKHAPSSSAGRAQPLQKAGRLQAENDKRFTEFVAHCSAIIQEHPEVLTYLRSRHSKASPDFLSSVEFRNTLERCFSRAKKNNSKIYVYINELCTVLKQRSAKRKLSVVKVESGPRNLTGACQSTSVAAVAATAGDIQDLAEVGAEDGGGAQVADDHEPSTSSVQEAGVQAKKEAEEAEKKKRRASQKQMAYLENLLRLYNEEIHRLQLTELSLDDLASEDSLHIQEHKLKRKMMKIYEKLCELKGCNTLTGRVIEQRIRYTATRYPEINKKIERFINSPEARDNPPDYQDIHRQVCRANERHRLGLNRKHLNQLAKEAFRDIGTRIQERRHLDLVYNFGSPLTDAYKPAEDPALSDPSLLRKLKANREESLSRLEEVISKFAVKQDDTEEQERTKRQQKAGLKLKNENENVNGVNEEKVAVEEEKEKEEEEEEEEEDESSDPDIEEEIQASIQQAGPDDDDNDEAEHSAGDVADHEAGSEGAPASAHHGEADWARNGGEGSGRGFSPLSVGSNTDSTPPLPPSDSPSDGRDQQQQQQQQQVTPLTNGKLAESEEKPVDPSSQGSAAAVASGSGSRSDVAVATSVASSSSARRVKSSGTSPPPCPKSSQKRKRGETEERNPRKLKVISDSEVDIPLDMGVFTCSSPEVESTPAEELVSSTQLTPPPKKNKVNVATQCDPLEVIVLSDSE